MESINFKSKKHYIIQLMADENINDPGVVQLLAPVTKNPNAKGLRGKPRGITPIQRYLSSKLTNQIFIFFNTYNYVKSMYYPLQIYEVF